jgi:hypothetical protein
MVASSEHFHQASEYLKVERLRAGDEYLDAAAQIPVRAELGADAYHGVDEGVVPVAETRGELCRYRGAEVRHSGRRHVDLNAAGGMGTLALDAGSTKNDDASVVVSVRGRRDLLPNVLRTGEERLRRGERRVELTESASPCRRPASSP